MSDVTPTINMFNSEFINAPLSTTVAAITIAVLLFKIAWKIINILLKHRTGHSSILKSAGGSLFLINLFAISISLKKIPKTGWPEKAITTIFFIILLSSVWYFTPALIKTMTTPADSSLLIWKKTGEWFTISKSQATAATILSSPNWSISTSDCLQNAPTDLAKYQSLTIEQKNEICKLLSTKEGKHYLDKAILKFKNEKVFIYSIVPFIFIFLSWMTIGFALNIYYSNKIRRYILTEQKKSIHCAHGDFKPEGIYEIYKELDYKTRC